MLNRPMSWMFVFLVVVLAVEVQAQERLFASMARGGPGAETRAELEGRGVRAEGEIWRVTVAVEALLTGPELLAIELPDGETVWARRDHFEIDGSIRGDDGVERPTFRWWGKTDQGGDVLLNGAGDQVAGSVWSTAGQYQLQPRGGRLHRWFRRADVEERCATPASVSEAIRSLPVQPSSEALLEGASKATAVVDVMMVYTPEARNQVGGHAAMLTQVRQDIDGTNRALANSGIDTRVRLIQVEETNFRGDGSSPTAMTWVTSSFFKSRQDWGADVIGLVDDLTDVCGSARYRGIRGNVHGAYFVLNSRCFGGFTTAHELGHLWGADHNREDRSMPHGNEPDSTYHDAFGLYHDGQYRTVMSYRSPCTLNCTRVPYFSNPAVSYLGLATGVQNQAENHRVIRDYSPVVGRFFASNAGPPRAPANLTAAVEATETTLQVRLNWIDRADREGHYELYRAVDDGELTRYERLAKEAQSFVDTQVEPGRTYRYQVEAVNLQGSMRSQVVEIEVLLLAAQLQLLTDVPRAGEVVFFGLDVEGGARQAVWTFTPAGSAAGGDGFAVTDASGWGAAHIFEAPGEYRVEVEVQGALGQAVIEEVQLSVGGEVPTWTRGASRLQSVIRGPRGGGGVFESQLWLHNAGETAVLADLAFLARGQSNLTAPRRSLTLLPGRTLYLRDVVSRLAAQGAGALSVEARVHAAQGVEIAPRLLAFGRSFVEQPDAPQEGASFGQRVGEEPEESWTDATRWIVGLYDGPEVDTVTGAETGWQATLHGVNLEDRPGRLTFELTDALGRSVGEPATMSLLPQGMRFQRVIQLFPDARAFQPPFSARVTSNGIRFLTSGTLLESASEDQVFLPGQEALDEVGATELLIPRVVEGPGQFAVTLSTRLVLHNAGDASQVYTLELLERGQDNSQPKSATVTVAAGETREIGALLPSLFAVEQGAGALVIRSGDSLPQAAALVLARTEAGLRFATRVDARWLRTLLLGATEVDRAIDFGAEQSSSFTAAYGVLNGHAGTTRLELILRDGQGVELARRSQHLRPRQHLERSLLGLFDEVAQQLQGKENLSVETVVLEGGPVLTYLVNVNVSGDIFYVPGRVRR